jgi:hypothetical protein
MKRSGLFLLALLASGVDLAAQAVPDRSQAAQLPMAYRRTPQLRVDPFRHVMIPHWGLVISGGALAGNNTLNIADVRALIFLADRDSLLISDVVNTFGLVPAGAGVVGDAEGEGGIHLGGPFGRHVSVGLSFQGRGYGAFLVDDDAVALLRDGNAADSIFELGETQGAGLGTAELGAHAVIRLGPLGTEDGVEVSLGFGGRYIRPLVYGSAQSSIADSRVLVTGDTVDAQVDVEALFTPDFQSNRGSGLAADFLVRLEWPTSGIAFEALLANLGSVTVEQVEQQGLSLNVVTTDLQVVSDSLEAADFTVEDTVEVSVSLPRIFRLSASAWANRILQLDVAATIPVGGDFERPLAVHLGSTWRFVNSFPLRAGLELGGHHGVGVTGGFGIETRNFYMQTLGGSFGGLFESANGVAARLELGFFF